MAKFNIGDKVVAQAGAPYYITTDGWTGTVTEAEVTYIKVASHNAGTNWEEGEEFVVNPAYFDHASGFKAFGDLTDADKGALLLAEHNGYTIQCRDSAEGAWEDITWGPSWCDDVQYRVKPDAVAEVEALRKAENDLAEHESQITKLKEELASLNV